VLQTVVGNDEIKMSGGERELCGIRLDEVAGRSLRALLVNAENPEGIPTGLEAAGSASEVQDDRTTAGVFQEIEHMVYAKSC
jgi:hypothetical protein